jgi:hypothetical protein
MCRQASVQPQHFAATAKAYTFSILYYRADFLAQLGSVERLVAMEKIQLCLGRVGLQVAMEKTLSFQARKEFLASRSRARKVIQA